LGAKGAKGAKRAEELALGCVSWEAPDLRLTVSEDQAKIFRKSITTNVLEVERDNCIFLSPAD